MVVSWYFLGFVPLYSRRYELWRKAGTINDDLRLAVFAADGWTCVYCGSAQRELLTVDHRTPPEQGGTSVFDNLLTACVVCHEMKQGKTPEEANMPLIAGRFLKINHQLPALPGPTSSSWVQEFGRLTRQRRKQRSEQHEPLALPQETDPQQPMLPAVESQDNNDYEAPFAAEQAADPEAAPSFTPPYAADNGYPDDPAPAHSSDGFPQPTMPDSLIETPPYDPWAATLPDDNIPERPAQPYDPWAVTPNDDNAVDNLSPPYDLWTTLPADDNAVGNPSPPYDPWAATLRDEELLEGSMNDSNPSRRVRIRSAQQDTFATEHESSEENNAPMHEPIPDHLPASSQPNGEFDDHRRTRRVRVKQPRRQLTPPSLSPEEDRDQGS
jgi:hypothetical protein